MAAEAVHALTHRSLTLGTCESLTAGLLAATVATVPGASAVLRGGLVTYSTELKTTLAGVDAELLAVRGAVDPDVARQMALGARTVCGATIGVACTGVAGPDPQDGRPVGCVHIAVATGSDHVVARELSLSGDREDIRRATVGACLSLVLEVL
nr:CinA family protein [Brevibacterium yomogidense]